jgi:ABC-type uncharacterized transport system permease subunit
VGLQTSIVAVLAGMFRTSPVVLLPALGEVMSERSGVYNVGLEGYMLMGALFGYYGVYLTGNLAVGILMGIAGGMLLSLIHAYFTITHKVNQILCGIALWILGMGMSSYLFRAIAISGGVKFFRSIYIPVLSKLPIVGPVIFQQNAVVYIALSLVAVFMFVLFRTPFGLLLRATGDNPLAVDVAGHNVSLIRYANVLISGAMGGFGGAYMSLGILDRFIENMTAGRGFVALALVIFGNWNPLWILGGTLIFTAIDSFQLFIQAQGAVHVPYPFLLMSPYVIAVIILVFSGRRAVGATKLFIPYTKGEE